MMGQEVLLPATTSMLTIAIKVMMTVTRRPALTVAANLKVHPPTTATAQRASTSWMERIRRNQNTQVCGEEGAPPESTTKETAMTAVAVANSNMKVPIAAPHALGLHGRRHHRPRPPQNSTMWCKCKGSSGTSSKRQQLRRRQKFGGRGLRRRQALQVTYCVQPTSLACGRESTTYGSIRPQHGPSRRRQSTMISCMQSRPKQPR